MWTIRPSEQIAVLGKVDPDSIAAAGSTATGWIDTKGYGWIMALLQSGDIVATGLLDATWQQATSAAGAGAKAITGADFTQMTQAGSDSNKIALSEFATDQLDVNNGFRYVQLTLAATTAAAECSAVVLGCDPMDMPVSVAALDEVVSLPA